MKHAKYIFDFKRLSAYLNSSKKPFYFYITQWLFLFHIDKVLSECENSKQKERMRLVHGGPQWAHSIVHTLITQINVEIPLKMNTSTNLGLYRNTLTWNWL